MRTAWAPKARRPTSKSIHVWPSSPSVWLNHILCSFHFDCLYLSNIQILLVIHVDQVFHMFCGAIPPSLMVFICDIWHCIFFLVYPFIFVIFGIISSYSNEANFHGGSEIAQELELSASRPRIKTVTTKKQQNNEIKTFIETRLSSKGICCFICPG